MDAQVFGEGKGRFDGIERSADPVRAAAVVGIKEGFQTGGSSALDLSERWPAGQEVAEQKGVTLVNHSSACG